MGTKKPRSLTTSGFFGVASIKDAQYGCGDGIWFSGSTPCGHSRLWQSTGLSFSTVPTSNPIKKEKTQPSKRVVEFFGIKDGIWTSCSRILSAEKMLRSARRLWQATGLSFTTISPFELFARRAHNPRLWVSNPLRDETKTRQPFGYLAFCLVAEMGFEREVKIAKC